MLSFQFRHSLSCLSGKISPSPEIPIRPADRL